VGARAAAGADIAARLRLEFDVACVSDDWSGFVLHMPAGAASSARIAVRGTARRA
jgi:hypothetical protein